MTKKQQAEQLRQQIYNKHGGKCAYCGSLLPDKWQVDHIHAKVNGGLNTVDNLTPACSICNHYKRDCELELFRHRIATLHNHKLLKQQCKSNDTIKKQLYMMAIAAQYGVAIGKPWCGLFYFETN